MYKECACCLSLSPCININTERETPGVPGVEFIESPWGDSPDEPAEYSELEDSWPYKGGDKFLDPRVRGVVKKGDFVHFSEDSFVRVCTVGPDWKLYCNLKVSEKSRIFRRTANGNNKRISPNVTNTNY